MITKLDDLSNPQAVILEAESKHDAYDLGALQATLSAAGRTLTVIFEAEGQSDYIGLSLALA